MVENNEGVVETKSLIVKNAMIIWQRDNNDNDNNIKRNKVTV